MQDAIDDFIKTYFRQGDILVAGRLQAAIALLERIREFRTLNLAEHVNRGCTQVASHERYANRALTRLNVSVVNRNSGRRSSNIGVWGALLLSLLAEHGFLRATQVQQNRMLDEIQERMGRFVQEIAETEPIEVTVNGRNPEHVIREAIDQADARGKGADVAQYLVAAKLELRLRIQLPLHPANKGDRKGIGDPKARTGDLEVGDATIEIALGNPDLKHLSQVQSALQYHDQQVWLLTRHDRTAKWRKMLSDLDGLDMKRVVVSSVEAFVGQNISEMGSFSAAGMSSSLDELFSIYNDRWVARLGTPAMRIRVK